MRVKIKGLPSNVVIRVWKVSVPHFDVQGGGVVVVHVEREVFIESRVERL